MLTRSELNSYYSTINKLIDKYLDDWNINPINLKKYLKKERLFKFIERNGLPNNNSIIRIINDVIDDRISINLDSVSESNIFSELKVNSNYPKILADFFDTNLSSIELINGEIDYYKIDTWEGNKHAYVFVLDDFKLIRDRIIQKISNEIKSKKVSSNNIEIGLNMILDNNKLESYLLKLIDKKYISNYITKEFKCKLVYNKNKHFIYIKK